MDHEDPYTHFSTFIELCSIIGASDKDAKVVYLRAFSFSLTGNIKTWLQSSNKSLNTWEEVEEKFIARFFPLSRFISAKSVIATFSKGLMNLSMRHGRNLKSLLWRCPNYGFDDVVNLHIFYSGLRP